jgi:hypothetical protein
MTNLRTEVPIDPTMGPYLWISWDKSTRLPADVILGGGLKVEVHLPDVIERLRHLADELADVNRDLQSGSK